MYIKELLIKHKPKIIVAIIIVFLIGLNIYTLSLIDYTEEEAEEIIVTKEEEPTTTKIKVDLKGQVNATGVYEMNEGDRVSDLLEKAGGVTDKADTSNINLSKTLEDEMVIIVYSASEVKEMQEEEVECVCPEENDACVTEEDSLGTITENSTTETTSGKISINTATSEELQTLSGIGESKAEAIIEYREENGAFTTIEEIQNVSGIGEAIFEKIKDNITT